MQYLQSVSLATRRRNNGRMIVRTILLVLIAFALMQYWHVRKSKSEITTNDKRPGDAHAFLPSVVASRTMHEPGAFVL